MKAYLQRLVIGAVFLLMLTTSLARAAPASSVPEKWHTPYGLYLTPHEAYETKLADTAGTLLIDVRTRAEGRYLGLANGVDANIPIRTLDPEYRWNKNKEHLSDESQSRLRRRGGPAAHRARARSKGGDYPYVSVRKPGSDRRPRTSQCGLCEGIYPVPGFRGTQGEGGPFEGATCRRRLEEWRFALEL